MAQLIFKSGSFYLKDISPEILKYISQSSYWFKLERGIYQTTNLKAAAEFRRYSTDETEKIFLQVFNRKYDLPLLPSLDFLDTNQIEGVHWALTRSRSYLAHAPGAGKTAQAIVIATLARGNGQNIFIVPPDLVKNWEREILKFTEPFDIWPHISVVRRSEHKHLVDWRAPYLIIPLSMIAKDWVSQAVREIKIKTLFVDEASALKEYSSERTIAVFGGQYKNKKYSPLHRRARHTVLLDGSPMPNRPMELWAPIYALDPEAIDCMDQRDFGFKYCGAELTERGEWLFRHSTNEELLHTKIKDRFMHVVEEHKLNHPERLRSILFMDKDVRTAAQKSWERGHLSAISIGDIDESMNQGELAAYRQELGLQKIQWISQYISGRLKNSNESILLFAWHREVCETLAKNLQEFKPGLVIGGVDKYVREQIFQEFQSGKRKLIIGNISAMGRGHNLQKADRVVFAEFSWTDELNKQCEKRASRRGRDQDRSVRCEYVAVPNSLDEVVLNSIFTKERRVRKVIG